MISVHFQGKQFSITVIQTVSWIPFSSGPLSTAPTSNAEEAEKLNGSIKTYKIF